jgi:hypothetical protein
MLDLCGLGEGFPGFLVPPNLSNIDKVTHIERAIKSDIRDLYPDLRADRRFVPYIQLHEYEGLLFSDPSSLAAAIHEPYLAAALQKVRGDFSTPEDINDEPLTSPSKRILQVYPGYRKVIDGTIAARGVGIEAMRRECPHFRRWIVQLKALSETSTSSN